MKKKTLAWVIRPTVRGERVTVGEVILRYSLSKGTLAMREIDNHG